jgi:hypothetical protein
MVSKRLSTIGVRGRSFAQVLGSLRDVRQVLADLVETANAQLPFAYRIDRDGDTFTARNRSRLQRQQLPPLPALLQQRAPSHLR